eukprot:gene15800-17393_t
MAYKNRENFEREWDRLFGKTFQLGGPNDYKGPKNTCHQQSSNFYRSKEELGVTAEQTDAIKWLKDELNTTKSLLNDYDIKIWRTHTNYMNLCSNISRVVKKNLNAELCTNAWLKFATILNSYDLIPSNTKSSDRIFGSVHLCEAPGAFITCLSHHLLKKHSTLQWNWLATTLNPYFEGNDIEAMINDDRFIKETLSNWVFGVDFSGNIMDIDNVNALKQRSKDLHSVDMVTADGGIDCSDDPCKQEILIAPLLYWEIVAAFQVLSPGGSFIIKMFTVLEKFTISLLYVLYCAFREVHVGKPGPSKPGNSEIYVVCKDFYGLENLSQGFIDIVMKCTVTKDYTEPLIEDKCMPKDFMDRIIECEEYFICHQTEAIQANIKAFTNISKGKKWFVQHAKDFFSEEFIKKFQLEPIESKDHIAYSSTNRKSTVANHYTKEHSHNFHVGNFYERQSKKKVQWSEKLQLEDEAELLQTKTAWFRDASKKMLTSQEIENWKPVVGKHFERIRSTQFCGNYVLLALFEVRELLLDVRGKIEEHNLEFELEEALGKEKNHSSIAIVGKNNSCGSRYVGIVQDACHANVRNLLKQCSNTDNVKDRSGSPLVTLFDFHDDSMFDSLDKVSGITAENMQETGVDILISSALREEQNTDQETSQNMFLFTLILALKILNPGGMLLCEIGDVFSNFNGGIICILSRIFDKLRICKPCFSNGRSKRYMVCHGYLGQNEQLLEYLLAITKLETGQNNTVLHLIPIQNILEDNFLRYLHHTNSLHAKIELHFLSKIQKRL